MSVTYKDINNDIRFIVNALDDTDRVLPSTARSFSLCLKVPMICVLVNAIFFVEI